MRAAAVASLARFGALVADLRPRILVLLSRALYDNDDEARCPALGCCPACAGMGLQPRALLKPLPEILCSAELHTCPMGICCTRRSDGRAGGRGR